MNGLYPFTVLWTSQYLTHSCPLLLAWEFMLGGLGQCRYLCDVLNPFFIHARRNSTGFSCACGFWHSNLGFLFGTILSQLFSHMRILSQVYRLNRGLCRHETETWTLLIPVFKTNMKPESDRHSLPLMKKNVEKLGWTGVCVLFHTSN